jgi:hypothetical protein
VRWALCLALVAGCTFTRKSKAIKPAMRPIEVGDFKGYTIATCSSGGHFVKLTTEPEERGEANNPLMVTQYRDRYLATKLKWIDVKGWSTDSKCAKSGLTIRVLEGEAGETLHRFGEALKAHPTDIEVTVVGVP